MFFVFLDSGKAHLPWHMLISYLLVGWAQVLALSEHMSIAEIAMFDTIVTQGQTVNEIMIILKGTVEVGQRSPAGPAHSVGYLGRGDHIGVGVLIEGVLEPFGYGGSLLALDEVTLAVMTKGDFDVFMKKHTLVGRKFYAHLVAQYMRHWMLGASGNLKSHIVIRNRLILACLCRVARTLVESLPGSRLSSANGISTLSACVPGVK